MQRNGSPRATRSRSLAKRASNTPENGPENAENDPNGEMSVAFDWRNETRRRRLFTKAQRRALRELGPTDPDALQKRTRKLLRRFLEDPHQP